MIIFDLDGTLADIEHRRHFVDPDKNTNYEYTNFVPPRIYNELIHGPERIFSPRWINKITGKNFVPDYKSFYEACEDDKPINPTIGIFRSLWIKEGEQIEIWSGRCESTRDKTLKWLTLYVFGDTELCTLKMRPIGDNTPEDELKERWLDETLAEGNTIDFVFDDRPKVIRMWRKRGIFVFNCCQHNEEF